jgi:hypothetical protein
MEQAGGNGRRSRQEGRGRDYFFPGVGSGNRNLIDGNGRSSG